MLSCVLTQEHNDDQVRWVGGLILKNTLRNHISQLKEHAELS